MRIRYCIAGLFLCLTNLAHAQVEVIVGLRSDADPSLTAAMAEGAGKQAAALSSLFESVGAVRPLVEGVAEPRADLPALPPIFVLTVPDSAAFTATAARWRAQPGVAFVQPNHRYRLAFPEENGPDPLLDSLRHLDVIRVREAWRVTTGQPDVRVGIVDTGILLDHPDLAGQLWVNPGEDLDGNGRADATDFNGRDDDGNGYVDDLTGYDFVDRTTSVEQGDYRGRDPDPSEDDHSGGGRGHGTLVAGVVGAALDNGIGVAGVAPGARLVPLRAFGADGIAEDDDVAAAIVYAADLGVDVLNLSFGDVFYSRLLEASIRYAVARGTVVVASGGNVGGDAPHYPSDFPEVISVVWLDAEGAGVSGRGTYGVGIDLGAPGSSIYTTTMPPPGFTGSGASPEAGYYGRRSGSSVAAPMVAGAGALLRTVDPSLSPAAIRTILTATARDLDEPGWDHYTGAGLLDVAEALARALPARVEMDHPDHNGGAAGAVLVVHGTAVDPAFSSYTVSYAAGDGSATTWTALGEPVARQVFEDTLAVWSIGDLPEGTYTLRLAVHLRTGGTVEDRRRVFIDRSAPAVQVRLLDDGFVGLHHGLVVDLETDDLADMTLDIALNGTRFQVTSEDRGRRHGAAWADVSGRGGTAAVTVQVTNTAGLTTTLEATVVVPPSRINPVLFKEEPVAIPHGYLLPRATDFDADGLFELTFNRYRDGWVGDTLVTVEWDGAGFRPAAEVVANVIPRDVGDTDGDGLEELLTQVGAATLVLEQPALGAYPSVPAFVDTVGLSDPFAEGAAFGARLTDLDGDGRGEILVHNTRQWRVLEFDGRDYVEVLRLGNPTGVAGSEVERNEFQEPEALVGDFDGDGRTDLLVGDADGDWIVYEAAGDNQLREVWSHETDRYHAGRRLAQGDFDGDGIEEFVTYAESWTQPTQKGEREPPLGRYYFWDAAGDDAYVLQDSLPVWGTLSRHGTLAGADFDRDGRDELVMVHPPWLYVLARTPEAGWQAIYARGSEEGTQPSGLRSIAIVTADFDRDGAPEVVAAGADERLRRFVYDGGLGGRAPPRWVHAHAIDEGAVQLAWHAPAADSVVIYRAQPGAPMAFLATTAQEAWVDAVRQPAEYALAGWRDGFLSAVSDVRWVRPHAPATLAEVHYPAVGTVALRFTEPLDPTLQPGQFRLGAVQPVSLLVAHGGTEVILQFDPAPGGEGMLAWEGVRDAEGTPVGIAATAVRFEHGEAGTLIVEAWSIVDPYTVRLVFSEALDPSDAADPSNYRLHPSGSIVRLDHDPARPAEVVVRVEGRRLGATGLETSLEVIRMQSAGGNRLAPEGHRLLLAEAAADLTGVYVFPNPHRAEVHAAHVTIAGLPTEATIHVLSVQGTLVRRIEARSATGGVRWDLTDGNGQAIPSGVYLVRVEAPGEEAVLRKVAVIR